MSSSLLTLRLDAKLKKQLERMSKAMSRSRSFVAAEAIGEYVALNEWQIEETKKALAEADQGDFAQRPRRRPSTEEVEISCALGTCEPHWRIWTRKSGV